LVKRYYLWIIVLMVILVGVLPGCTAEKQPTAFNVSQVPNITSQQAFNLIQENQKKSDFVILDVRTAAEFAEGHIANSVNIDVNLPAFRENINKLKKSDTYLVYCRTGNRSQTALRIMVESGFTHLYHLEKGVTEWTAAGLPVIRQNIYTPSHAARSKTRNIINTLCNFTKILHYGNIEVTIAMYTETVRR
jgi:rhodanese-related sulfurtransferase